MTDTKTRNTSPFFSDCPTLFVVGATKGGTTSMIQYVSKHEDFEAARLNGPKVGEIFFLQQTLGAKSGTVELVQVKFSTKCDVR